MNLGSLGFSLAFKVGGSLRYVWFTGFGESVNVGFCRNIGDCVYVYIYINIRHSCTHIAHPFLKTMLLLLLPRGWQRYPRITTPSTAAVIHTGDACPLVQQLLAINSHLTPITPKTRRMLKPAPRNPETPYPQPLNEPNHP